MQDDLTKTVEIAPIKGKIPAQPEFIGPYKIESLLKQGGMSLLYLGVNPKTSQTVVIKVLLPKYLKNKEVLNRLLREAKILSLVTHPSIVKLYDLGKSEQGLFIAMEYVQGVSLRQFIKAESLTHRRALEIVLQIAYALAHLHTQGIIHRDLKPDNILITESGDIKVIDFGISEFVESEDIDHKTHKKSRMGTPQYMSPEQKEHPDKVSYGTDIFSLGIIAYELYFGRQAHGVIQTALLPRGLHKIIEKTLQLDPKKRYTDIIDFIADLSEFLASIDEETKKTTPEELYRLLEETSDLLLSKSTPEWSNIEIGIALKEEKEGSYLDFLPLTSNRYAILLASPVESGLNALFLSSMLRGMFRMASVTSTSEPVPYFLNLLNRSICDEKTKHTFDFSLLFLDLEHNLLAFASSQPRTLCHYPQSPSKLRFLETDNPVLGQKPEATFLEIKENWNSGDLLILSSFNMASSNIPQTSELILDTKILAAKILETMAPAKEKGMLIALKRL